MCFECASQGCNSMGYYIRPKNYGIKYLITRSKELYCAYPYLIELTIGVLEKRTVGEIIFSYGDSPNNSTIKLTE